MLHGHSGLKIFQCVISFMGYGATSSKVSTNPSRVNLIRNRLKYLTTFVIKFSKSIEACKPQGGRFGAQILKNLATTFNREKELILNTIFSKHSNKILCNHTRIDVNCSIFRTNKNMMTSHTVSLVFRTPNPPNHPSLPSPTHHQYLKNLRSVIFKMYAEINRVKISQLKSQVSIFQWTQ